MRQEVLQGNTVPAVSRDAYGGLMTTAGEPTVQPVPHACAVCGQVVSYVGFRMGEPIEWIHGSPMADHPVIAVPEEEIRANARCDFCLADLAEWVLPVKPYEVAPGQWNAGNWAVCDDCASELSRDRWSALITRVKTALEREGQAAPRSVLEGLYSSLRANVIGPVRRRRSEHLRDDQHG